MKTPLLEIRNLQKMVNSALCAGMCRWSFRIPYPPSIRVPESGLCWRSR